MSLKSVGWLTILTLTVAFCVCPAAAQFDRSRADDAFDELEEEYHLRFYNALTGDPIPGATVEVENIGTFFTDFEGKITFSLPEDGKYLVLFQKEGFITSLFQFEVQIGSIFFNRFSVSPKLPLGTIRIVLDWDDSPADLDAHFVKQGAYHISYRHKRVSEDGTSALDRDDTNGYGPETITTRDIDPNAAYQYFIHNYSDRGFPESKSLSKSKASVKVYGGDNELLHVFQIPPMQPGIYWHVFSIVNDEIIPINEIRSE